MAAMGAMVDHAAVGVGPSRRAVARDATRFRLDVAGRVAALPWPVFLLILSFLAPSEMSVYLAGLKLPPHRVALLVLVPIALCRMAFGGRSRLVLADHLVLLFGVWTCTTFVLHHGLEDGLPFGGAQALESIGGYLVARVWIRDLATFRRTIRLLLVTVAISAAIALPEAVLGQPFMHQLMHAVTGVGHYAEPETRWGLTRAYATFDHPIHYATYGMSVLAMAWFTLRSTATRWAWGAVVAFATFLGLSSAPLLGFAVQAALIGWERTTRWLPARTWLTLAGLGTAWSAAAMMSPRSPVAFIASTLTINPQTGWYRIAIWEYGFDNVVAHPWLGIGLNDWARPEWMASASVDTFWLLIAMRSGIPTLVVLLAALLLLVTMVWRQVRRIEDRRERRVVKAAATGWTMALIAFMLVAGTVHLWNVPHTYFFFVLGFAGWMIDPVRRTMGATVAAAALQPERRLSTGRRAWAGIATASRSFEPSTARPRVWSAISPRPRSRLGGLRWQDALAP